MQERIKKWWVYALLNRSGINCSWPSVTLQNNYIHAAQGFFVENFKRADKTGLSEVWGGGGDYIVCNSMSRGSVGMPSQKIFTGPLSLILMQPGEVISNLQNFY